jgi:hypothetical protein
VDDLKSELSGDFEKVMLGLMMTPAEFDAFSIKDAVRGAGTDEKALVEVLCSRNNQQIEAMKAAYKKREPNQSWYLIPSPSPSLPPSLPSLPPSLPPS